MLLRLAEVCLKLMLVTGLLLGRYLVPTTDQMLRMLTAAHRGYAAKHEQALRTEMVILHTLLMFSLSKKKKKKRVLHKENPLIFKAPTQEACIDKRADSAPTRAVVLRYLEPPEYHYHIISISLAHHQQLYYYILLSFDNISVTKGLSVTMEK